MELNFKLEDFLYIEIPKKETKIYVDKITKLNKEIIKIPKHLKRV